MRAFLWIPTVMVAGVTVAGCGGGAGNFLDGGGAGGGGEDTEYATIVTLKVPGATPAAVATQIGTEAFSWLPVSSEGMTLSVPLGTENFAVAYACPDVITTRNGTQYSSVTEYVVEASTKDGTSLDLSCPKPPGPTGTLTAKVDMSGIRSTVNYLGVSWGSGGVGNSHLTPGKVATFSESAPIGPNRVALEAYEYIYRTSFSWCWGNTLKEVTNFHEVTVPGSVDLWSYGGRGGWVTTQPITYKVPFGSIGMQTRADYLWPEGGHVLLADCAEGKYPAIPPAAAESGDFYEFQSTWEDGATVYTWAASAGPLEVTFPAHWRVVHPQPAALPVFVVDYTGFTGSANVYFKGRIDWGVSTRHITRSVMVTANHLGDSKSVAMPDLSTVTGFAAPPASGKGVSWYAEMGQTSYPVLENHPAIGTASIVWDEESYLVP